VAACDRSAGYFWVIMRTAHGQSQPVSCNDNERDGPSAILAHSLLCPTAYNRSCSKSRHILRLSLPIVPVRAYASCKTVTAAMVAGFARSLASLRLTYILN